MKTAQLIRKLDAHHAESNSWQKTGDAFDMSKAVAFRIARKGYDPADPAWRKAHGLGKRVHICKACNRRVPTPRTYKPKPISRQSQKQLLWSLQNRVVIQ